MNHISKTEKKAESRCDQTTELQHFLAQNLCVCGTFVFFSH